jgi:hypothetical protein
MERGDKRAFQDLIRTLAVAFRTEVTPALLQAYWLGCEEYPLEHVSAAVKTAIREKEFMPPVAQLRDLVRIYARQLELFPPPETKRQLEAAQEAEERRILATWDGHEDELAEMRRKLREGF